MRIALAAALTLSASAAAAQTAPAPQVFDRAPWWMDKPVIASVGYVWTELPANRATTSATYQVIERDAAAATKGAADKVRQLGEALSAYGADKVRVESSFAIKPLYAQYKDKQGEVNDNERSDKIERYEVSARIAVEIRDVRLAEQVYATLMSAKPADTQPVIFRLEPENETRTQMQKQAVEDARRRAQLSADAAGARIGVVRLIDPTARACETDVLLVGAGRSYGGGDANRIAPLPVPPVQAAPSFDEISVTARKRSEELGLNPAAYLLPLQPPLKRLEARACVIFSLG